jgi:hypothetical protein
MNFAHDGDITNSKVEIPDVFRNVTDLAFDILL